MGVLGLQQAGRWRALLDASWPALGPWLTEPVRESALCLPWTGDQQTRRPHTPTFALCGGVSMSDHTGSLNLPNGPWQIQ